MLTKSEKTRQMIIERSAVLFNTKGFAATSLSDILEATGLAKGGVYGHFDGKDAIAVAAFDYSYAKLQSELRAHTSKVNSGRSKLNAVLDFYKDYTLKPVIPGGCFLLNTAIDADDNIPFLKVKAKAALNDMLSSLQNMMELGIRLKEFRSSLLVQKEAELMFALIEGGIMMSKLNDDPAILNRILEHLRRQIQSW